MCLNVKPIKKSVYFCTKIYELINNYFIRDENKPCQEVEDGYIFVNIIVGK